MMLLVPDFSNIWPKEIDPDPNTPLRKRAPGVVLHSRLRSTFAVLSQSFKAKCGPGSRQHRPRNFPMLWFIGVSVEESPTNGWLISWKIQL